MIAGRNTIETMAIIAIYIIVGRRLCYYPSYHKIKLPPKIRRALFGVDLQTDKINPCGVIWQCLFIATACVFLLGFFQIDSLYSAQFYSKMTGIIILVEWIGIGVPMGAYCGICEILIKRRKGGSS